MKTTEFTYGLKTLNLYMNGNAMFAIEALDDDSPADQPDALEKMLENNADGITLLCKIAHILATQGELCRRYLQYTHQRIPTEQELLLLLSPMQLVGLRSAVIRSINDGYSQAGVDEDGDIDTGLAELEKKTKL